eukprot:gnl/MRDRNA2_/MRDRNA2_118009_c0_seq1.p1 gnl/MRDRNA2_/MRDRNA2_118009_c0~~gnl/MRDRNA2_/MRDRNA2_118009_c0_seq1.p1  ORF type:complete len:606 (+),score=134.86 gnl/MRDRNA2_/MRDRNA2_118009_c0_seq1:48-1865(+)
MVAVSQHQHMVAKRGQGLEGLWNLGPWCCGQEATIAEKDSVPARSHVSSVTRVKQIPTNSETTQNLRSFVQAENMRMSSETADSSQKHFSTTTAKDLNTAIVSDVRISMEPSSELSMADASDVCAMREPAIQLSAIDGSDALPRCISKEADSELSTVDTSEAAPRLSLKEPASDVSIADVLDDPKPSRFVQDSGKVNEKTVEQTEMAQSDGKRKLSISRGMGATIKALARNVSGFFADGTVTSDQTGGKDGGTLQKFVRSVTRKVSLPKKVQMHIQTKKTKLSAYLESKNRGSKKAKDKEIKREIEAVLKEDRRKSEREADKKTNLFLPKTSTGDSPKISPKTSPRSKSEPAGLVSRAERASSKEQAPRRASSKEQTSPRARSANVSPRTGSKSPKAHKQVSPKTSARLNPDEPMCLEVSPRRTVELHTLSDGNTLAQELEVLKDQETAEERFARRYGLDAPKKPSPRPKKPSKREIREQEAQKMFDEEQKKQEDLEKELTKAQEDAQQRRLHKLQEQKEVEKEMQKVEAAREMQRMIDTERKNLQKAQRQLEEKLAQEEKEAQEARGEPQRKRPQMQRGMSAHFKRGISNVAQSFKKYKTKLLG